VSVKNYTFRQFEGAQFKFYIPIRVINTKLRKRIGIHTEAHTNLKHSNEETDIIVMYRMNIYLQKSVDVLSDEGCPLH
jgi:hypothetical protein